MKKMIFFIAFTLLLTNLLICEEALFYVSNAVGDTVFAVYPTGIKVKNVEGQDIFNASSDSIRFYVKEERSRGSRGGFAIGGVGSSTRPEVTDYFTLSPDSVRFYLNEDETGRGSRGGFAIGGVGSSTRDNLTDYLKITPDSTKITVKEPANGFQIASVQDEFTPNLMQLTESNSFIGLNSGKLNSPDATFNTFIGYQSGFNNFDGDYNSFIGYESGFHNTLGDRNVFIGNRAGYHNIGDGAFEGANNVFIGNQCGYQNTIGQSNVFIGELCASSNQTGRYNVMIGKNSGAGNVDGNFNVYLGGHSGAGPNSSNNVFIGYGASVEEDVSNQLRIQNNPNDTPLIEGDFAQDILQINDVMRLKPRSVPPNDPMEGMIFYDATTHSMKYYNGFVWVEMGIGAGK